jgi:hypothetical protein
MKKAPMRFILYGIVCVFGMISLFVFMFQLNCGHSKIARALNNSDYGAYYFWGGLAVCLLLTAATIEMILVIIDTIVRHSKNNKSDN